VKGFGLGLYYAQVIMEAHKGSISVEKNEDSGSVFVLKIPIIK
jgi:K+-sensing histidine kinase KdpD